MKGKMRLITTMLIFGSIGIFVKKIDLTSSEIAFLRGVIGSLFLLLVSLLVKHKPSFKALKKNAVLLLLSGAAIGFNWIFLFESYRYTTISNATISYYFAPIFVMLLSPLVLKEKLTSMKVACIITAMVGLFLIVNPGSGGTSSSGHHALGIFYGLLAAAFYASIVLMNKFIKDLSGFETTLVQLMAGALVLLPYILWQGHLHLAGLNSTSIMFILILGVVHTGAAYFLYFTSIQKLKGQTIAVLSYIDPISAVLMASIFLSENMTVIQLVGGVLVLGATFLSELTIVKKEQAPTTF
ncbi:EamA family transporter [Neobacillus sp. MM2021_6]|uniref:DMT family transporter n=1 Tax=Bacillaceae TaxID=186817 RepID=UPI001407F901|nr:MULTISPECIES: EamA family transporter [Bacillaceae]MBO0961385.1 EamA family transporter [Neobacillus sp. MM2021_6]NHC20554.1 EamA family transporter [Bacillus sp. MM2020_4]